MKTKNSKLGGLNIFGRSKKVYANLSIRENEEYLIAWIEKSFYGDLDDFKHDLMKLSEEVGFRITRIEIERSPSNNLREIVKAYTDTYSEIPRSMKGIAKKWVEKISWSCFTSDIGVNLE